VDFSLASVVIPKRSMRQLPMPMRGVLLLLLLLLLMVAARLKVRRTVPCFLSLPAVDSPPSQFLSFSCHSLLIYCCLYNHCLRSRLIISRSSSIRSIRVQAGLCRRPLGVAVADAHGHSADGSVRARTARLACGHFPGLALRPHPRPRPEQQQHQQRRC